MRARLGKRHKKEVIEFEMNLSENLWKLHYELKYKKYKTGGYYSFVIYDPKKREIQAIGYRDRIVQHSLCDNYLMPLLEKHLIHDNAACRKGKGTHFAIKRLRYFMTEHYKQNGNGGYFVKVDVKKFFSYINHSVLKEKLKKLNIPEDVLSLLCTIIDSYQGELGVGLPMGNQSSQAFALFYLNDIDKVIKEKYRVKYYVRYMDDLIMLVDDREKADKLIKDIGGLLEKDKLIINPKSQVIPVKNGISFLGWTFHFSPTGKIIQKVKQESKKRMYKKAKLRKYQYMTKRIGKANIEATKASYIGHLKFGNGYIFMKKIEKVLEQCSIN